MNETTLRGPLDASRVLVMVLAGGEGRRLGPLTQDRAKPAVPFGARYRIIDIVLSNLVNSGLHRIKVLTQYKSASLEEHIARAWRLSPMLGNFIEAIPAQQRTGKSWYKGSADAVHQCANVVEDEDPETLCIFGGDHVYKMDVRQMLVEHHVHQADCTIAAIPVPREEARAFGVIECDEQGRVIAFHEKVEDPPPMPGNENLSLASMGNYIFQTEAIMPALAADAKDDASKHDFGHNILPGMVAEGRRVYVYDFNTNVVPGEEPGLNYWRDIGTIDAYFWAQMDLVSVHPQFNLYNRRWPIRTGIDHSPPAKFVFRDERNERVGVATESIVSLGCIISGGRIHRTVLGNACRINSFSDVQESVLMENVNIGRHARIRRAVIDKDVDIAPGTEIGYDLERDRERFFVSDGGIVVIPKKSVIGE